MATSVTQNGITIAFDADYVVGQYVTGDYYVVCNGGGTVGIVSMTPDYYVNGAEHRNGWQVNPSSQANGFDSRTMNFDAALIPTLPYTAHAGESILKAISYGEFVGTPDIRYGNTAISRLETVIVLTVVAAAPAAGSFRPPYCGTEKADYNTSSLLTGLLPQLAPVASTPNLASLERRFGRLQMDHISNTAGETCRPLQHMESYGGYQARSNIEALLRLCLNDDLSAKLPLLYSMIQYGIDLYYAVKNANARWVVNGGHDHGRKMPIVFAATMLGDTTMQQQVQQWAKATDLFQDDWDYRYSQVARLCLYGSRNTEANYWTNQLNKSYGAKDISDPYGWIDGGSTPGDVYQAINDPHTIGTALLAELIPSLVPVWNNPSISHGNRVKCFGTWALPDPYQSMGSGAKDGIGRYPTRHGNDYQNSAYTSAFITNLWESHRGGVDGLFLPHIEPYGGGPYMGKVVVSLDRFRRITPDGYPEFWKSYDAAEQFPDGTYPYVDGVEIRYTTDGSEPSESSSLYTAPFELTSSAIVKAKSFKTGFVASGTNQAYFNVAVMPIAHVASTSKRQTSSATKITLDTPTGTQEGDVLIAVTAGSSIVYTTPLAGWTQLYTCSPDTWTRMSVWYRVATAGEPATHEFPANGSSLMSGGMSAYRGVDTTAPINISDKQNVNPAVAPAVSTNVDNCMILRIWGGRQCGLFTPDSSNDDLRYAVGSATTSVLCVAQADQQQAASGTTGTSGATPEASTAYNYACVTIALAPSIPADTTPPAFTAATVGVDGRTITFSLDEATTVGAGGNGGVALSMSGGPVTATYASGSGSASLSYNLSRTIAAGETGTCDYTQPGNGWEDAAGNDVETFSGNTVTNNSEIPTAPSSLSATAAGSTTINLAWTNNSSNESGFDIYRSTDGNTFTKLGSAAADATSYADETCEAGTKYYYYVKATNDAGDSAASNTADATTGADAPETAPGQPTNLAVAVDGSLPHVMISWDAADSTATAVRIERWDGSAWVQHIVAGDMLTAPAPTSVNTDLLAGTNRLRAVAINGAGESTPSAELYYWNGTIATTFTISGPSKATKGRPAVYTVSLPSDAGLNSDATISLWVDSVATGATAVLNAANRSAALSYVPGATGTITVEAINDEEALTPPAGLTVSVVAGGTVSPGGRRNVAGLGIMRRL